MFERTVPPRANSRPAANTFASIATAPELNFDKYV